MSRIPYIEGTGRLTTLYVDGKPFHARSGEIHNSSSSCLDYMDESVWPALRPLNMNCVVAPIYWECVEPEENVFNFDLIDGLLAQARREKVRLILLWFGLWKNAASTYVPRWVKQDQKRFWYEKAPNNQPLSWPGGLSTRIISPLCQEGVDADAKAFAAVMRHLKEADGEEHTVVMMQVENAIGCLGAARDYSPVAEAAFAEQIPSALAEAFGIRGSWAEAFGSRAPEAFMAWHYGRAVERIASSGKSAYPLPMYVNAWLEDGEPGNYPSGGPQFKNYHIWRIAAPSIDVYAPDNYQDCFREVCDEYASEGNALLIPETRSSADSVAFFLYAVGRHNAMCFAPFGIEDMMTDSGMDPEVLAMLNISTDALTTSREAGRLLGSAYTSVESIEELIDIAHREGRIHGFMDNGVRKEVVHLTNVDLEFNYGNKGPFASQSKGAKGGGLVIELGDYEFLVLAANCTMSYKSKEGSAQRLDLISKEEGYFAGGKWVRKRILNGDEIYHSGFKKEASFLKYELLPCEE